MKKIIAILFLVVILLFGGFYLYNQKKEAEKIEAAKQEISVVEQKIVEEEQMVEKLRTGDGFLKKDLNEDEIESFKKRVKTIEEQVQKINEPKVSEEIEKLNQQLQKIDKMIGNINGQLTIQNQINALFIENVVNGEDILETVIITTKLTEKEVDEITISKDDNLVGWTEAMQGLQQEARKQIQTFHSLKKELDKLTEKQILTMEELDEKVSLVNNVQNDELKSQLKKVLDSLNDKVQDINNLSEGEIARRALAILLVEYYNSDGENTDYYESRFTFEGESSGDGGIQYLHRMHPGIDGKLIAGYRVERNGDIEFYNDIGGAMGIGEEIYGNIFDVDQRVLGKIREDVSDLAPEIWEEIEREYVGFDEME